MFRSYMKPSKLKYRISPELRVYSYFGFANHLFYINEGVHAIEDLNCIFKGRVWAGL